MFAFNLCYSSPAAGGAGLLLILASAALAVAPASAQEWVRFRGPDGAGISATKGLPATISEGNVRWKVRLPGTGHSSPVVWGEKVFLTCFDPEKNRRQLVCVDAADGAQLWAVPEPVTPYRKHRFNSFASATPTVDAEGVYLAWTTVDTQYAMAVDHAGKELWKKELGRFHAGHGSAVSPIVVGDVVIIGNDHEGEGCYLIALDRKTGKKAWKRERATSAKASYITPATYTPEGGKEEVIFVSLSHGITSLDPASGELNWEIGDLFSQRNVAGPVVADGLIFAIAGQGGGGKESVAVRPGSNGKRGAKKADPEVVYKLRRGLPYVPTPVVVDGLMFFFNDGGIVTCVRAATGEEVWKERLEAEFFGSPVCIGKKLYIISKSGELWVLEAADRYRLLGRSELGEGSYSTPAVSGGRLFLRTESQLYCVGPAGGEGK